MDAAGKRFRRRNKAFLNTFSRLRSVADTSSPKVHFNVGDTVCEKVPSTSAGNEIGVVVKSYESGGEYRYVVKFGSGREAVLFEKELVLDYSKP
jgi:hypothetical protein